MTSEEEVQIARQQALEEYNFLTQRPQSQPQAQTQPQPQPQPQPQTQQEKRFYCAVCCSPTTTRCSQCKAVRYCSGKCQIVHWRQGHKDECRPATLAHVREESECCKQRAPENPFEKHLNDAFRGCSDSNGALTDSGSSSSSLSCFSSSTMQSEASNDASAPEAVELGTPINSEKAPSACLRFDSWDSNDSKLQSHTQLNHAADSAIPTSRSNKIKRVQSRNTYEGPQLTNSTDKKTGDEPVLVENSAPPATKLSSSRSSSSARTSSSGESRKTEVWLTESDGIRSVASRDSGDRQGRAPHAENDLPSAVRSIPVSSQSANKGLKSSVRKFVQHLKASKQSKSSVLGFEDQTQKYNEKAIFLPKLFLQLYSCDDVELHPFGLVNCGNSCYVNAVLQCLAFTRPVTSYLLQGFHSKTCRKKDWCFICEFECLVRKGQEGKSPLSPIRILSQIQKIGSHLSHGREEDAHEFLRYAVDTMQSVCLEEAGAAGPLAEESTLVGLTFGGYLRSKIKCMKCSGRSERFEQIMDLTVEIDGDIDSLEEALARFTASETLGGDNKYRCSRCKSYEKAKKKLTILHAPNILTIVLKRFQSGNLGKLKKIVKFPESLNLAPYMDGANDKCPTYYLYAVIVHLDAMSVAYSGHYICYVKDLHGDWFRIDDSRVMPVDLATVLYEEAYILLYARHTPKLSLRNSSILPDAKTKWNLEAISTSRSGKKRNSRAKPNTDPAIPRHSSGKHSDWMTANDFSGNDILDSEGWKFYPLRNPILDSPSDSSSIFSVSDAASYSTDSTKDSSAEDISGYIFGSNWYGS